MVLFLFYAYVRNKYLLHIKQRRTVDNNVLYSFFRVGESANEEIAEKLQADGTNGINNPAYVPGKKFVKLERNLRSNQIYVR